MVPLLLIALGLAGLAVAYFYVVALRGHLSTVAELLDKPGMVADAQGFWAKLNAKLLGWKTVILAGIAGAAQVVPPLLNELLPQVAAAPWAQVIDSRIASWITIACAVLIPLTHAAGMSKAAVTIPSDQG